jgi:beta-ureidopropionase
MSRPARIATVCQNGTFYPTADENRAHVIGLLDLAFTVDPDLVCLPETFTTVGTRGDAAKLAEPVPGPTTDACAKRAKEHGAYVVCPIRTKRDGAQRNSAVIIGRDGGIVGIYDKSQPVTTTQDYTIMERGVVPGPAQPPVFDLDFGRVGVQICFDAGFAEGWQALADQGARLVLWPSAYNGGFALRAYAYLHHYFVVSSVRQDRSRIIDPLGGELVQTDQRLNMVYRDINLDFAVSHWDFNYSVPDAILHRYGARVRVSSDRDSAHFLVEPMDPTISTNDLQQEFRFETTAEYHDRHRRAYEQLRAGRPALDQAALHADRPQYSRG